MDTQQERIDFLKKEVESLTIELRINRSVLETKLEAEKEKVSFMKDLLHLVFKNRRPFLFEKKHQSSLFRKIGDTK